MHVKKNADLKKIPVVTILSIDKLTQLNKGITWK